MGWDDESAIRSPATRNGSLPPVGAPLVGPLWVPVAPIRSAPQSYWLRPLRPGTGATRNRASCHRLVPSQAVVKSGCGGEFISEAAVAKHGHDLRGKRLGFLETSELLEPLGAPEPHRRGLPGLERIEQGFNFDGKTIDGTRQVAAPRLQIREHVENPGARAG